MNILQDIFENKAVEVEMLQKFRPLSEIEAEIDAAEPPLDFVHALRTMPAPALIAEIKRASPSRGLLLDPFDPLHLAAVYQENGAAAISVLTESQYFQGDLSYLTAVSRMMKVSRPQLPLLRKDFIFSPYQIYESRAAGADALLLIAAYLEKERLLELHALTLSLGMTPLVEVHTQEELTLALDCAPRLVGINNRNLQDFSVRIETTLELREMIAPGIAVVAESGIRTAEDIYRLAEAGVDAVLVGEALVTAPDIGKKTAGLARKNKVGHHKTREHPG